MMMPNVPWNFRVILGAAWVDINDNLRSYLDQQSPPLALMETQVSLVRSGHLFLLPSLALSHKWKRVIPPETKPSYGLAHTSTPPLFYE